MTKREIDLVIDCLKILKKYDLDVIRSVEDQLINSDLKHVYNAIEALGRLDVNSTQTKRRSNQDDLIETIASKSIKGALFADKLLASLRNLFDNNTLGGARRMMYKLDIELGSVKSKADALYKSLMIISKMNDFELELLEKRIGNALPSSDRSIEGWSDIIERNRDDRHETKR